MDDPKYNAYGLTPRYEPGDRVRIWKIFNNPIGTVEYMSDPDSFPIKYRVKYYYHDGTFYSDVFDSTDLTLVDRRYTYSCNCETATSVHMKWCNKNDWRL